MKKNILFSAFLLLLTIFILIFGYKTYQYYTFLHSDDPISPYLRVMDGTSTILRGQDLAIDMGSGETYSIEEGDIIITKPATLALINWPDRSKTRLGSNTRLTVNHMRVADDYSSIEIEMKIEQGKIWSNVIRTIYPGSYFRAKLPEGGIIAGVRGTTFDINLDLSYIRSIDHSITLSDNLGHIVSLLPGEVVSAKNILEKISSTLRDRVWVEINSLADSADEILRSSHIEQDMLFLHSQKNSLEDRFMKYILGRFKAFEGLHIMDSIETKNIKELTNIPEKKLLQWYQYFQEKKFLEERENIRITLAQKVDASGGLAPFLESLARGAVWDSITFSGTTLAGADAIVGKYADTIDAGVKNVLKNVPLRELQEKAKETLRTLIE